MKAYFLVVWGLLLTFTGYTQTEITDIHALGMGSISTASSRGYDALGINPANLGLKSESKLMISLPVVNGGVTSDALQRSDIRKVLLGQSNKVLTTQEKKDYAQQFANKGFSNYGNMQLLAIYAKVPVLGALAGNIRFRSGGNLQMSPWFSDLLFNGYNAGIFDTVISNNGQPVGVMRKPKTLRELTYGSQINQQAWLEYNIGWGVNYTKVLQVIDVCFGVNIKIIQGIGFVDYNPSRYGGNVLGYAALPEGKSFSKLGFSSPFTWAGANFNAPGKGFGFDMGSTFHLATGTTLGIAATNMGSINWTKNVTQINASTLDSLRYSGATDFQVYNQANQLFTGNTDLIKATALSRYSTNLPSQLRIGMSQDLFKVIHFGFDIVLPLNKSAGNIQQPLFALGGEFKLKQWTIGSGYSQGGNLKNGCWSAGLFWRDKHKLFECGIATRDWVSYFKPTNNNLSLGMATMRFMLL